MILIQLKLEDRILELQQLNTTDLQKENEAKDAEISELKEKTFVSLQIFFSSSSAAKDTIFCNNSRILCFSWFLNLYFIDVLARNRSPSS